jgi:hypothetical protein
MTPIGMLIPIHPSGGSLSSSTKPRITMKATNKSYIVHQDKSTNKKYIMQKRERVYLSEIRGKYSAFPKSAQNN